MPENVIFGAGPLGLAIARRLTFGSHPTPHPQAIAETISWFASQGTTRLPVRTS